MSIDTKWNSIAHQKAKCVLQPRNCKFARSNIMQPIIWTSGFKRFCIPSKTKMSPVDTFFSICVNFYQNKARYFKKCYRKLLSFNLIIFFLSFCLKIRFFFHLKYIFASEWRFWKILKLLFWRYLLAALEIAEFKELLGWINCPNCTINFRSVLWKLLNWKQK